VKKQKRREAFMDYAPNVSASAIETKLKETQACLGLRVEWIRSAAELTKALHYGLANLYQQVFADPPYNEHFTFADVKDIFCATLDANGFIFTAGETHDCAPVAFVASVPLATDPPLVNLLKPMLDITKASYFSEDGTRHDRRQQGISTQMKNLLLYANFVSGFEKIILRTSIYNYRQISAVCKAGGEVISNLYQDVESTRSDGAISSDKRAFYLFDINSFTSFAHNIWNLPRVTIARPGGNDTAIVWTHVDREKQGPASLLIQETFPGVEQVMFVEGANSGNAQARGQMAGGEFCGNATRSLGYLHLDGNDGFVDLEISGATTPLRVEVQNGFAKTQIPILTDLDCIKNIDGTGEHIVDLEGISFLITYEDMKHGAELTALNSVEQRKDRVLEILKKMNLVEKPAAGILVLKSNENEELFLDPYVFVRDTGTLYFESGCGSGSTAVGLMLSKKLGRSIENQRIIQPSGMSLYVSVGHEDNKFTQAHVSGPIEVLFDGRMYLSKQHAQKTLGLGT
jgi:histidine racemase